MTLSNIPSSGNEIKNTTSEIYSLTTLRMIAALLVFVHHFGGPITGFVGIIATQGHIGVTIFFVLSGFLFTIRYYDKVVEGNLSLYDYFTNRIARIYPIYFFVLIITFFYSRTPAFAPTSLVNWTLTQGFFTELKFSGVPTAWSLTTEESFYLLAPLVYFSLRSISMKMYSPRKELFIMARRLVLWSTVLAILGLGLMGFSHLSGLYLPAGFMSNLPSAIYTTIFFRFSNFAIGIFCGRLYQKLLIRNANYPIIARICLPISIVGVIASAYLMYQSGGVYAQGWIFNYSAALFAGVLIIGLACDQSVVYKILSWSPLVYLGKISYILYIIQFTVIVSPLASIPGALMVDVPTTYRQLALYFIVMNIVSAFLYEVIEKPGSKYVKRLSQRFKIRVLELRSNLIAV